MYCTICPRNCNIDREKHVGFCKMSNEVKVALADLFFYEEPIISGTQGSGAIFFSGCNMRCVFCQNQKISAECNGKNITVRRLADIMRELTDKGAHNINLVSPTQFSTQIVEALEIYRPPIPVIYNTNGYETVENIARLKDYVDVYLTDLKYVDTHYSTKFSMTPNYFEIASKAIIEMVNQKPEIILKDGIIQSGVIIRHLVLPTCIKDSFAVADRIKAYFGNKVLVSFMSQYTPCNDLSHFPEIDRKLKPIEYKAVIAHLEKIGLTNGFIQYADSSDTCFIPDFNNKNV